MNSGHVSHDAAHAAALRMFVRSSSEDELTILTRYVNQQAELEAQVRDLLSQIAMVAPRDDHGHDFRMNDAYLKCVERVDNARPSIPPRRGEV